MNPAEQVLASIKIPPRPTVLLKVMEEQRKPDPDMGKLAEYIASDVSLAAAVLKTVNSPFFGLSRQVTSIRQTVNLLGIQNISTLVTGLAARTTLKTPGLEQFWDEAMMTAHVAAHIAPRHGGLPREVAYTYGLFHDCGIPLMLMRFPEYADTMRSAKTYFDSTITESENTLYNTNHAVVGGLLASNWLLPPLIREAIRRHHETGVFATSTELDVLKLIAIGHLAEHLVNESGQCIVDGDWQYFGAPSLDLLHVLEDDLEELRHDTQQILQACS